jgi:hypothetical protein
MQAAFHAAAHKYNHPIQRWRSDEAARARLIEPDHL